MNRRLLPLFILGLCLFATGACERRSAAPRPSAPPVLAIPAAERAAIDVLLKRMHARLDLMHTVARVKWNAKTPIHDPEREQALLENAVARGKDHQLDADVVRRFFAAQMEAARLVQEEDFRHWRAENVPPFADVPELATLRKRIDTLNHEILAALASAWETLGSAAGQAEFNARASELLVDVHPPARMAALRPLIRE